MPETMRRCAVLGTPIAHSLSPVLHAAAYRVLGLDHWRYERHEIAQESLEPFIDSLDPQWRGLSLTMPLKRTIQPLGRRCDAWSDELGVSNTAVFDWKADGTRDICLYNTDVSGIVRAFTHAWHAAAARPDRIREAVILGNGNTAASALAACTVWSGGTGHVTVVARHPDAHPDLPRIALRHGIDCDVLPLSDAVRSLERCDVAISTLPAHAADGLAVELGAVRIRDASTMLDVVYSPRPSALLAAWRRRGAVGMGGEEMLLYQAMEQVRLMTGDERAVGSQTEQAMREALEEAL